MRAVPPFSGRSAVSHVRAIRFPPRPADLFLFSPFPPLLLSQKTRPASRVPQHGAAVSCSEEPGFPCTTMVSASAYGAARFRPRQPADKVPAQAFSSGSPCRRVPACCRFSPSEARFIAIVTPPFRPAPPIGVIVPSPQPLVIETMTGKRRFFPPVRPDFFPKTRLPAPHGAVSCRHQSPFLAVPTPRHVPFHASAGKTPPFPESKLSAQSIFLNHGFLLTKQYVVFFLHRSFASASRACLLTHFMSLLH